MGVFGVEKTEMAGRMITSSSPTVFAYLSANHQPTPSHTYGIFEMPNSLQFTEFMFFFKCDYSRNIDQGMDLAILRERICFRFFELTLKREELIIKGKVCVNLDFDPKIRKTKV